MGPLGAITTLPQFWKPTLPSPLSPQLPGTSWENCSAHRSVGSLEDKLCKAFCSLGHSSEGPGPRISWDRDGHNYRVPGTHLNSPAKAKAQRKSEQMLLEDAPGTPSLAVFPRGLLNSSLHLEGVWPAGHSAHGQWPEHMWADPKLIKGDAAFLLG